MSSPLVSRARSGYLKERPPLPWVTHPAVSTGILHMLPDGNRLYLTHGTTWEGGAHHLAWIDLDTGEPVTGPLEPTEGFSVIRKINGRLFALWADPTAPFNSPVGYTYSDDNGQTWLRKLVGSHFHVLDIREHDGALYLAGAGRVSGSGETPHATVWRSLDNGDTWERSLTVEGVSNTRVYSLLPAGGSLWCIVSGTDTPYELDGDEWIARPDIPNHTGWAPVWRLFREGRVVEAGGVSYGLVGAFDGTRFLPSSGWVEVVPGYADATHVYGLQSGSVSRIMRAPLITPGTPDSIVMWEDWIPVDKGFPAQSVTYHNGYFYVGGFGGQVFRYPETG